MVVFPNCKINIGLNILNKRQDGYHNLQTIFYPISINDVLEIIEQHGAKEQTAFTSTGIAVPGEAGGNLCLKAYDLLKTEFPSLPAVKIHLHKCIPMGAGLGGGSADAVFALKLLNKKLSLNISDTKLIDYALQLGSDCPFFLVNQPCLGTGRGEILKPIPLDLSDYKIYIINPGIHISTSLAFSEVAMNTNIPDLEKLVAAPINQWRAEIVNDFEKPVFAVYPEIAEIKNQLYEHGAVYASMSGSGSTVYGIFEKEAAPALKFPPHYFQRWV